MSFNVSVVSGAVNISGGVTTSGGHTVSGGVTVSGLVVISGFAAVSGLWTATSVSGIGGVSGVGGVANYQYDYSGAIWTPMHNLLSGINGLAIVPQYKRGTYQGLSGLFSTAASSVPNLSGGVPLSSGVVNTVTIRNWSGNTPIYVGSSGSFPASGGGAGFILYGGDGITIDVGPNMNLVYVVANISGQLISHFGTFF